MMRPLYDKILVEPLQNKSFTCDGIELTASMNTDLPVFGKVVSVGNGLLSQGTLIPLTSKVGDVVIYPRAAGKIVYSDDKQLILIRETDVLGIEE